MKFWVQYLGFYVTDFPILMSYPDAEAGELSSSMSIVLVNDKGVNAATVGILIDKKGNVSAFTQIENNLPTEQPITTIEKAQMLKPNGGK